MPSRTFFLMPTRAEAQGIVFNESAAYGLPVVSTDVGGVSTVVQSRLGFPAYPPRQDPRTVRLRGSGRRFLNRGTYKYQAFSEARPSRITSSG